MSEYEHKVASIHAWVIATKAENDELRKEVRRITGEHTHLQESVIKPLENVLVPVGLYSHQSYAACVTALREANADLIQRAEAAEKALADAQSRLAHTQAGLSIWMERSKANAAEYNEAYDAMCDIAKTLDCAEDWAAIKGKLEEKAS